MDKEISHSRYRTLILLLLFVLIFFIMSLQTFVILNVYYLIDYVNKNHSETSECTVIGKTIGQTGCGKSSTCYIPILNVFTIEIPLTQIIFRYFTTEHIQNHIQVKVKRNFHMNTQWKELKKISKITN